ncbi:MAG TPA: cupin domain-containing protein [Kiloniellales bacterium]|nr:cupin domain-containing protein [Kiloniellales bacterium]
MATQGKTKLARATLQHEDDRVRVTRYDFRPGEATGHHRHEYPYVIVPVTSGQVRVVDAKGEGLFEMQAGVSYTRPLGVEHDVIYVGDATLTFLEIELKR